MAIAVTAFRLIEVIYGNQSEEFASQNDLINKQIPRTFVIYTLHIYSKASNQTERVEFSLRLNGKIVRKT